MSYKLQLPLITKMKGDYWFFALRLRNRPGVLTKVAEVFAKANINILGGTHTVVEDGGFVDWITLTDFSKSKVKPSDIAEKLSRNPDVVRVDYGIKVIGGIGFPPFEVAIIFGEEKATIWRYIWLTSFLGSLIRYFKDSGQLFLYQAAYIAGYNISQWWKQSTATKDPLKLIQVAGEALKAFGWIRDYEIVRFQESPTLVVIRLFESFESQAYKKLKVSGGCYFMLGLLAGYVAGIFGVSMVAREEKCEAKGHGFCEFHISVYKA